MFLKGDGVYLAKAYRRWSVAVLKVQDFVHVTGAAQVRNVAFSVLI